jgi:S1-C subfamily serine protease
MPHMLRSRLIGYVSVCLGAAAAMLAAMAAGSGASAFDIKKVEASVYKVFATPKGSTGTGFLVSGRRTVITNFHVIEKNTEFMVIYRDAKRCRSWRRVSRLQAESGLAVLRVDRTCRHSPYTGRFRAGEVTNVVTVGFRPPPTMP